MIMSGMTAFLIAVSGVSLVCYWLMARAQNRGAERRSSFDGDGADSTYSGGGSDGWSIFSWFGGDNSSSHNPASSSDVGSSDGGGGDGGGGDGGGGSGGD
jgi:hypothetical protein